MKNFLSACILFCGCVRRVIEPQLNPPSLPPVVQYIYELSRPHWLHDSPVYTKARHLEKDHQIWKEFIQNSRYRDDPIPIVLGETPEPDMYQFLDVTWWMRSQGVNKHSIDRKNFNIRIAFTLKPRDATFAVEEFNALKKRNREWVIGDDFRFVLGFPEQHWDESGIPDPQPGIYKFFRDYMHEEFTIIGLRVLWNPGSNAKHPVAEIFEQEQPNEFYFYVPY